MRVCYDHYLSNWDFSTKVGPYTTEQKCALPSTLSVDHLHILPPLEIQVALLWRVGLGRLSVVCAVISLVGCYSLTHLLGPKFPRVRSVKTIIYFGEKEVIEWVTANRKLDIWVVGSPQTINLIPTQRSKKPNNQPKLISSSGSSKALFKNTLRSMIHQSQCNSDRLQWVSVTMANVHWVSTGLNTWLRDINV